MSVLLGAIPIFDFLDAAGIGGWLTDLLAPDTTAYAAQSARLVARVSQLHGVLDPIAQEMRTSAVMSTQEGTDILASGIRDLAPEQRALAGPSDLLARLPGEHAEITAMDAAAKTGLTPAEMAVSRPICSVCRLVIRAQGGVVDPDMMGAYWP